jgi:hypothetical protein
MPRDHHFLIAGLRYLWRYTRLRGTADGWTYYADTKKKTKPKILIDSRLSGRARLEIEIHEWLHAEFPHLSEETVTEAAKGLARILWALGYRIDEDKAPTAS